MSYASLLINTCTIESFSSTTNDDYGLPVKTWADFLTDEPCRLVPNTNREVKVGAEVVLADYILFLGDKSVTEQMRVLIGTTYYEILSASTYQDGISEHHQELLLRTVK